MALTKVTGQVIKNTTDVTVGVLTVTSTLAVGGTVSIGGTLTYEDVTNVDAVGLITARNGIVVGSGITLSKDGDVFFTGIATGNGSGLTALNASNLGSGTVPTARLGSGTASSSTFLRGDSTFQTVNTDLVSDTSPQLGGNLDVNTKNIVFGDSGGATDDRLTFGDDTDLSIYHDGNSVIHHTPTGSGELQLRTRIFKVHSRDNSENIIKGVENGQVELYYNNSKKLETTTDGIQVTGAIFASGKLDIPDDAKLMLGTGDDLQIYHQSSDNNSYIVEGGSGSLMLQGDIINLGNVGTSEYYVRCFENGAVQLRYDNSTKLATTNTGTVTTGIATATEFVPTVGQLSHRNLIINGAMQVCQRYALASMNNISGSTHTYHTDRFKGYNGNGGILGLEWQENYPEGYHYSLRIKCVNADSSINGLTFISHVIEDKNIQHLNYGLSYAKSCTLSFWIKSNLTGTYSVGLINDTQGSRGFVAEYTISAANTWEKKTITVPGDTSGTWNAGGLRIHWALAIQSDRRTSTLNSWHTTSSVQYSSTNQPNFMSSTSNYMNLTGVQFEVGSATPYEHIGYGDELTRCQRYYQLGHAKTYESGGGNHASCVPFNTSMRTGPSMTYTASGGASGAYAPSSTEQTRKENFQYFRSGNESDFDFAADAEL